MTKWVAAAKRSRQFLLLMFLLASHLGAFATVDSSTNAQDLTALPLESLMQMDVPTVSSASKFEQKTTEAPASVTVITADEFSRYGYQTLADALESAQGFQVSYDRDYSFLGIRGIELGDFNSRVLLLVDGHRVNNNLDDGAYIGNEFILDTDLIDKVEIVRGPGSALYGNNAFFGVINVVTRKGRQLNGFELSTEYESFDTYKERVSYGKVFTNGMEVLVSGTYYNSAGIRDLYYPAYNTPAQNNGVATNMDGETYESGFGSLHYRDFSFETAIISRTKVDPTAQYFTTFNDQRLETLDERAYANLKYDHTFANDIDLNAQVYYDWNYNRIGYPFGPIGGNPFYEEKQSGDWWGSELQASKTLYDRHTITLGGEYRDDFLQHDLVFEPSTGQVFTDTERTRVSYGVYGEGNFALMNNLHLNAGVRFDRYGTFSPKADPRVALIYDPVDGSTLKAIYGTAFRVPNFLELSDPRFQNILPEEINSVELDYEQTITHNLRSSIAAYYNQMTDLIALYDGNYINFDADAAGIETALEGNWANGIRGRVSYTFQHTENRSQNETLPDSPSHLAKLNVSVPIYGQKIFAGLEVLYTSSRATLYTTTTGETLPGEEVPEYATVNFTLFSQNLLKNLQASATLYNLLDEHYADPATRFHLEDQIPQDGRSFRIKLTYRF